MKQKVTLPALEEELLKMKSQNVRNIVLIILSCVLLFSSSCVMKKAALHYFDLEKPAPAKALPVSEHNNSEINIAELCNLNTKTGSILDDVELISALEQLQLSTPVFFLLASFVLSWIALHLLLAITLGYLRQITSITSPIPLFIRLNRLVLYA